MIRCVHILNSEIWLFECICCMLSPLWIVLQHWERLYVGFYKKRKPCRLSATSDVDFSLSHYCLLFFCLHHQVTLSQLLSLETQVAVAVSLLPSLSSHTSYVSNPWQSLVSLYYHGLSFENVI